MDFKKVIITGGAGFIGSHLADALVEVGKDVIVIDKRKPSAKLKNAQVKYKKLDVQSEAAFECIQKEKPDVVFHLAAHIHDRESVREPVKNAEDNIIGTLNILEALRERNGDCRVVFASTGGVIYGNQSVYPVSEDVRPQPLTPYAISKLTAESYLAFYRNVYGVQYMALRFSNVYGPRQDSSAESGAIGIFAANLLKGEAVYINDDGKTTRDYVYVEDAVRALILAAESDYVGVMNIGTGKEVTTNALFELVRDAVGSQVVADVREEVKDIVKRSALDASRAKKSLKWEPKVMLEEGIEKTIAWYKENL